MAIDLDIGNGQSVKFVSRQEWGASPMMLGLKDIRPPVGRIRFAYTGKEHCKTPEECMKIVKNLQQFYRNNSKLDLPYNFLVGGDGRVYEALGWQKRAGNEPNHVWIQGKTIVIAYIGNFVKEVPSIEMLSVAMDLVKYGLKERIINPLFKLVPGKKDVDIKDEGDKDEYPDDNDTSQTGHDKMKHH